MKFVCVDCDRQMSSVESARPDDGTLAMVFRCPSCEREIAMLTNPMETQMVNSLCVDVGGAGSKERQPFESIRAHLETRSDPANAETAPPVDEGGPRWSEEAERRLARIPGFVRGMVRLLYADWASARGIGEITPAVMDRARGELGLEEE